MNFNEGDYSDSKWRYDGIGSLNCRLLPLSQFTGVNMCIQTSMIYMWSLQEFIGILRKVVIGSRYHVYSIKDTMYVPSFGSIVGNIDHMILESHGFIPKLSVSTAMIRLAWAVPSIHIIRDKHIALLICLMYRVRQK